MNSAKALIDSTPFRRISFGLRAIVISAVFVLLCFACSKHSGSAEKSSAQSSPTRRISNMSDLRAVLTVGMSTNELRRKLGEPNSVDSDSKGVFWLYNLPPFPPDDQTRITRVVGVVVGVTNGNVQTWNCVFAGPTLPSANPSHAKLERQVDNPYPADEDLKLYVVHRSPSPGTHFIDTIQFPKLGFIAERPELSVKKIGDFRMDASSSATETTGEGGFSVLLKQPEAEQLKSLTATNISNRLLIVVNEKPIAAPTVVVAIENGVLGLHAANKSEAEWLQRQLAKIKDPK